MENSESGTSQILTAAQCQRLGHAFLAGCAFESGQTVYVVASTALPFQPVQGVFATLAAAQGALAAEPPERWSVDEQSATRAIYQVVVPDLGDKNVISVVEHETTNVDNLFESGSRTFAEIASVELRITWTDDTVSVMTPPKPVDALFITRGAFDLFAMPAYAAAFGPEYATTLRAELFGA